MIGALAPTIALGVLPAILAIAVASPFWLGMGLLMIFAGGGDLTIILKLLACRCDSKDVLYVDHPYQGGLVRFERQ